MKKTIVSMIALLAVARAAFGMDISIPTRTVGEMKLRCDDPGNWSFRTEVKIEGDREFITVELGAPAPAVPPRFEIGFTVPQRDIRHLWSVNGTSRFPLPPEWAFQTRSNLASGMPLYAFIDDNNANRLLIACDEVFRDIHARLGLREEGCLIAGNLSFFDVKEAPCDRYKMSICLDSRDLFWSECVIDASRWMSESAGCEPCRVPDTAYEPLYSSWYQFHQNVSQKAIEEEGALAAGLGLKTIIVDDGWQTDDNNRGYAYCGDWKVSPRRFPEFSSHVRRVQDMGMKYMLWYSVPFIGEKSENFERFRGCYLYHNRGLGAWVLDPRFPQVRKFLIDTYVTAAKEWGLDGFKLDFIDSFSIGDDDPALRDGLGGRDIPTVPQAVDVLMTGVRDALQAIKPDVLIEFRQSYVGPAIARYGNMLRVGDCPGDCQQNRIGICNLRLGAPGVAIHSDMLEWNGAESPQQVARTILSAIFGVVQYSVMLRDIPEEHLDLIRHWLGFSVRHRDALLKGWFRPFHPEAGYPVVSAGNDAETILAVYQGDVVAQVPSDDRPVYILNAGGSDSLALELTRRPRKVEAFDMTGRPVRAPRLASGLVRASVPSGGYLIIR